MDREIICNAIATAKTELKKAVAHKVSLTQQRTEYKLSSRGSVPEPERLAWFRRIDSNRYSAKASIRYLHLAYGYLRGHDYKRMEPRTDNDPSAYGIQGLLEHWLPVNHEACNVDTIIGWLNGQASPCARPAVSPGIRRYRALAHRLRQVRSEHGEDTEHEEPILDEMDQAWYDMTDDEHKQLDGEGSICPPEKSEVAA
jgi:hypothetical protein